MAAQVRPGQHTPRVVEGSWHMTPPVRQLEDVVVVVVVVVAAVVVCRLSVLGFCFLVTRKLPGK